MRALLAVEQLRRPLPGGIGRYAGALVEGLVALGAGSPDGPEVALLASRPPRHPPAGPPGPGQDLGADPDGGPGRAAAGSGHGHRAGSVGPGRPADPLSWWGLPVVTSRLPDVVLTRAWDRGLVRAPGSFDVVHSVSLSGPGVRRGRAPGGGTPALAVTVHDLAWHIHPESTTARGRRWHEAALRRALRRADALLAPAEAVAEELRASGARPGAVTIVPLGADHLPPPDREGARAALARLGVSGPYLLSASTLEPRKNLGRLVRAYAAARPALPEPWPLVVVGPHGWGDAGLGGVGASLAGHGAATGAGTRGAAGTDGVVAAGMVPDGVLAGLYEGARAFAYVPLTEGYGLPPMEAMVAGVPVVASTGVPSADPEPGGEPAALRVDPLDVDAIAEALVRAASDEALREELVARGTALARSRPWRRCARGHLDLWERLV